MFRKKESGGRKQRSSEGGSRSGGPRGGRGERGEAGGRGPDRGRGRVFRKKVCRFCGEKGSSINFKDSEMVQKFLTEKGKIIPRRITGNCSKHQRTLARAIKRTRHSALIAFQID